LRLLLPAYPFPPQTLASDTSLLNVSLLTSVEAAILDKICGWLVAKGEHGPRFLSIRQM